MQSRNRNNRGQLHGMTTLTDKDWLPKKQNNLPNTCCKSLIDEFRIWKEEILLKYSSTQQFLEYRVNRNNHKCTRYKW